MGTIQQIALTLWPKGVLCYALHTQTFDPSFVHWRLVNITFKNISVTTFVAEIGVPREIHRPVASHWQTLSHNVLSSTPRHEWGSNSQVVICNDCTGSCHPEILTPFPKWKPSSDMNNILCTAWLMKSHDITMEDRHPRNVGFSHQGFA